MFLDPHPNRFGRQRPLVVVLAGRERASSLAQELGVEDWSPAHDSDQFRPEEPVHFLMPRRQG